MYKGYTEYGNPSGFVQKSVDTIETNGDMAVSLGADHLVRHAEMYKDGHDLILETPEGKTIIQDYYASDEAPNLVAADGTVLTPQLVESFLKSDGQYANAGSLTDESPVGAVKEITGEVTITRLDGTSHTAEMGSPIYQGDIVETAQDAAVNITFIDETDFAISGDSRLSIDEYIFDPDSNEGSSDFSVLKGLFVYTSGLISEEDPDDVNIDTPMGSIGIRGTIIAGNVDNGEITVVEGAIVLRDFSGNEVTLANQFETARFEPLKGEITSLGELSADQVTSGFEGLSSVSGGLFSSIQDAADEAESQEQEEAEDEEAKEEEAEEEKNEDESAEEEQVDATEALKDAKGLQGENIMELNAAKEIADDLNDLLKNIGGEFGDDDAFAEGGDDPVVVITNEANVSNLIVDLPPGEFFSATQGITWQYDFNNAVSQQGLTFALDPATQALLNGFGALISYNFANGILEITPNFLFGDIPDINIIVSASDGTTEEEIFFLFDFYESTVLTNTSTGGSLGNLETYREDTEHNLIIDYTRVFMDDSNAIFDVSGNNNEIHMGENGANTFGRTLKLSNTATGNHVIGGTKGDTVIVENSDNQIDTLDGDDLVRIDLTQAINATELNIDMGGNEESYAEAFAAGGDTTAAGLDFGDVFQLDGNGSIDLTNVTQLAGIETISFNANHDQDITLNAEAVFDMSESDTLVINIDGVPGGGSDADLDLTGGGWSQVDADGNGMNDTVTIDGETYDVWEGVTNTGEVVTLLVEQGVDVNLI